jgi:hypothetical protein
VQSPKPGVHGQVSTLEQDMVIVVDGLEQRRYGIYLQNSEGIINRQLVEATNSMVYVYLEESSHVSGTESVLVIETDELTTPEGPTVFEARRPDTDTNSDSEIGVHPVGEPAG